jgi:hypothetical protein
MLARQAIFLQVVEKCLSHTSCISLPVRLFPQPLFVHPVFDLDTQVALIRDLNTTLGTSFLSKSVMIFRNLSNESTSIFLWACLNAEPKLV